MDKGGFQNKKRSILTLRGIISFAKKNVEGSYYTYVLRNIRDLLFVSEEEILKVESDRLRYVNI